MTSPRILLSLFALIALPVLAEVQVIDLRHRSPEQVIPALRPHLAAEGALSGFGGKLIISTDPANLQALRQILQAIDQPPRQLLINVRMERSDESSDRGGSLSGRLGTEAVLRGRVWGSKDLRDGRLAQQVRVSEGSTAFIHIGVSVPVAMRQMAIGPGGVMLSEGTTWRDLGSGFAATPSLSGDQVRLEISPGQDTYVQDPRGVVLVQRLSTSLQGRLGEWIVLGGGEQGDDTDIRGYVGSSSRALRSQGRMLLMVEEIPPSGAQ